MKKYITEFIGTFFLVLVIGLSGNPIAVGGILMIMVYMGGHISGAHYNPAVSFAMLLQKEINTKSFLYYTLFQILGALAAAWFVTVTNQILEEPKEFFGFLDLEFSKGLGNAARAEFIWTFALVLVIFNVACSKRTKGNSYYGLAIGTTVAVGAYVFGDISGGVFNPAVEIGPMIFNAMDENEINLYSLLLYTLFPFLGGILAYFTYNFINSKDPG